MSMRAEQDERCGGEAHAEMSAYQFEIRDIKRRVQTTDVLIDVRGSKGGRSGAEA